MNVIVGTATAFSLVIFSCMPKLGRESETLDGLTNPPAPNTKAGRACTDFYVYLIAVKSTHCESTLTFILPPSKGLVNRLPSKYRAGMEELNGAKFRIVI